MSTIKINWDKYSYTEEQLREAVKSSPSFRQVMIKLGIKGAGAGYKIVRRLVKVLNLDTSHFQGKGWAKGVPNIRIKLSAFPLEQVLVENSTYNTYKLKLRLIEAKILSDQCSECSISEWNGQKLSLHIDHINGINDDNRLENLRLLCPNCHSLTSTYCGKNKKKSIKITQKKKEKADKETVKPVPILCAGKCGKIVSRKAKCCKSCAAKLWQPTKIQWPSIEYLESQLKVKSCCQLARELGVSDNTIRKHIKNNKLVAHIGPAPILSRF